MAEAISSLLKQTLENFELIIVDDGSTDATSEVISSFNDSRIIVLRKQKNSGIVNALNAGLRASRGEFIARADQDDLYSRNRLALQARYLRSHPDIVAVGSFALTIGRTVPWFKRPPTNSPRVKMSLAFTNPFVHSSVMMRRDSVESLGSNPYRNHFPLSEDLDLWERLSDLGNLSNLNKYLVSYRIHEEQMSRVASNEQRASVKAIQDRAFRKLMPNHKPPDANEISITKWWLTYARAHREVRKRDIAWCWFRHSRKMVFNTGLGQ